MSQKTSKYAAKWFVIGTEGATTDGRKISADWITQMARNYSPEKYGARINLEHIKGILPSTADSPFGAYGDVSALRSGKNPEGKLTLEAQLTPTDQLVAMTKAKQKVYTSMEVDPNFADSGEAYLVGLAVTDTPASLGTSYLSFCASNPDDNPLKGRKISAQNLFTAATEINAFSFDEPVAQEDVLSKFTALVGGLGSLIEKLSGKAPEAPPKVDDKPISTPADVATFATQTLAAIQELGDQVQSLSKRLADAAAQSKADGNAFAALKKEFAELRTQLEDVDPAKFKPRPTATGGTGDDEFVY